MMGGEEEGLYKRLWREATRTSSVNILLTYLKQDYEAKSEWPFNSSSVNKTS